MSDKTEQPTPKRLRDAREKGDICKGQDLAPAATILALAFYLIGNAESIFETLVEMFTVTLSCVDMPYEQALERVSSIVIEASFALVLPLVGLLMAVALIVLLAKPVFFLLQRRLFQNWKTSVQAGGSSAYFPPAIFLSSLRTS